MEVGRADNIQGTTYIMTEKHYYIDILNQIKVLESRVIPIKDVGLNKTLATGYKVPSNTDSLDKILQLLKDTAV